MHEYDNSFEYEKRILFYFKWTNHNGESVMLTFEECKWYHKVMWTWLSENPRCDKHHWPIFKEINESIPYDCFACYFVCNNTIIRSCEFCPIDWGVTSHYDAPLIHFIINGHQNVKQFVMVNCKMKKKFHLWR